VKQSSVSLCNAAQNRRSLYSVLSQVIWA